MTALRGWGLPEQHLATEALAAFVDGELSASARDRAASHLAHCSGCAADARAQRQARAAVRSAGAPETPQGLMAALQSIPQATPLPQASEDVAVNDDGPLVTTPRTPAHARNAPTATSDASSSGAVTLGGTTLGTGPTVHTGASQPTSTALGSTALLGSGTALGGVHLHAPTTPTRPVDRTADQREATETREHPERPPTYHGVIGRRGRYGAGVVVSGLVLGALALMNPSAQNITVPTQGSGAASGPGSSTAMNASYNAPPTSRARQAPPRRPADRSAPPPPPAKLSATSLPAPH